MMDTATGQRWKDNTVVQTQGASRHRYCLHPFQPQLTNINQIGEVVTTIPTIGFNVESVTYKNLNFNVWV